MKITGIILTKDGKVDASKKSLSFCDEVLVIKNENITDFSEARNMALGQAKNNWVLFLDDDEIVGKDLANEMLSAVNTDFNGFYLNRSDVLWDKEIKHGETAKIKLLRFGKKDSGRWKRKVHEYWDIDGRVGELKNPITHYPHQTLKEFIANINKFSRLHAKENFSEGKKSSLLKIILWPKLKFLKNFIINLGFLDGMRGFIIALMMSFHSFLAWSELWLMQRKKN